MTIYNVELNGQKFRFEGNHEPTEAEARQHIAQLGSPNTGFSFSAPGAAIRSALQGTGYTHGALNPDQVPKFQDQALDAFYKSPVLQDHPFAKGIAGNLVSAGGLAADIATDPTQLLAGVATEGATRALAPTGAGQAIGKVLNTNLSELPGMLQEMGGTSVGRSYVPKLTSADADALMGKSTDELGDVIKSLNTQNANGIAREAANQIQIKGVAAKQTALLQSQIDRVSGLAPQVAREANFNVRNPSTFYPPMKEQYRSFGNGIDYSTKGVNVPEEDLKNILVDAGQKHGLLDADGNVATTNLKGPERNYLQVLRKYKVLSGNSGVPSDIVDAIRTTYENDPTMQAVLLKDAQKNAALGVTSRGFGYKRSDYTQAGATVPLQQVLDEVAGVRNSALKGAPQPQDRIATNLHRAVMDYLDQNADKLGFDAGKKGVLQNIKKSYKPFADWKANFYDQFSPNSNDIGAIEKGTTLLAKHALGETNQSEAAFLAETEARLKPTTPGQPGFSDRLNGMRQILVGGGKDISGKPMIGLKPTLQTVQQQAEAAVQASAGKAYQLGLEKDEIGNYGKLKEAMNAAQKKEAGFNLQSLFKQQKGFLTGYLPKRIEYSTALGLLRSLFK